MCVIYSRGYSYVQSDFVFNIHTTAKPGKLMTYFNSVELNKLFVKKLKDKSQCKLLQLIGELFSKNN